MLKMLRRFLYGPPKVYFDHKDFGFRIPDPGSSVQVVKAANINVLHRHCRIGKITLKGK